MSGCNIFLFCSMPMPLPESTTVIARGVKWGSTFTSSIRVLRWRKASSKWRGVLSRHSSTVVGLCLVGCGWLVGWLALPPYPPASIHGTALRVAAAAVRLAQRCAVLCLRCAAAGRIDMPSSCPPLLLPPFPCVLLHAAWIRGQATVAAVLAACELGRNGAGVRAVHSHGLGVHHRVVQHGGQRRRYAVLRWMPVR